MLKLNNTKILTIEDLRRHFSFGDILRELDSFVRFPDFVGDKAAVRRLCDKLSECHNDLERPCFEEAPPLPFLQADDAADPYWHENRPSAEALLEKIRRTTWSAAKQDNVFFLIAAIHYLSRMSMQYAWIHLSLFTPGSPAAASLCVVWDGAAVTAHPLPPEEALTEPYYYIRPHSFFHNQSPICTRRFAGAAPLGGHTRLFLLPDQGEQPMDSLYLRFGDTVFLQITGGELAAPVPDLSAGSHHCICRLSRSGGTVFRRFSPGRAGQPPFDYDTASTDGIAQFSTDGGKGFCGVRRGIPCLFTGEDLEGLTQVTESLVSVHADGDLYLALAASGKVYTNFQPAQHWPTMLSVLGFDGTAAYGISQKGALVTTNSRLAALSGSLAQGRRALNASLWAGSYFVRYTDGTWDSNQDIPVPAEQVANIRCTAHGAAVLTKDGDLYWRNSKLDSHVREAAATETHLIFKTYSGDLRSLPVHSVE